MKLSNLRIRRWRSYVNTNKSEELLDVYRMGGRDAVKCMQALIPPSCGYEKWIYKNESERFQKKRGLEKIRFLVLVFTDKEKKTVMRMLEGQKYRNYRMKVCGSLQEIFAENFQGREDYVIFLDESCHRLAEDALWELAEILEREACDFLYSDQDEWDALKGRRKNPFFKPDWSPDTLESFFYTGNAAAYRMDLCRKVRISCEGTFESCMYRFTREFVKLCSRIGHVPEVLYHGAAPFRYVEWKDEERTKKELCSQISVVIPSKDHPEILEQCVRSIRSCEETGNEGRKAELIIVDNGSTEDNRKKVQQLAKEYDFCYIYEPMPFNFSEMCNLGARKATGEYLLFLNDDVEAREPGWMAELQSLAGREHAGAVGAKLYYPESRKIQHIGVVNLAIGPGHCFLEKEDRGDLYFGRNRYDYNCLAVTAACMMIERKKFEQLGGFDEAFRIGYNDVDLCFSLYEQGYYNIVCNRVSLYHHESLSRGYDSGHEEKEKRLKEERARLYEKHPKLWKKDPFYNKNLSGWLGNFELNLDEYGRKEDEIAPLPDSRVEKLSWDIRPEWLNPDLVLQIDYIRQKQTHISIRGWAYIKDADNSRFIRRIILRNRENESFWIGTRSRYREYLGSLLPEIAGMEMLAFTCDFSSDFGKRETEAGPYQIGMAAESKDGEELYMIFTDQWILTGTEDCKEESE